jgi:hypothetical protein
MYQIKNPTIKNLTYQLFRIDKNYKKVKIKQKFRAPKNKVVKFIILQKGRGPKSLYKTKRSKNNLRPNL